MVDQVEEGVIDCMGKKVNLGQFCKKKFPRRLDLLKGQVDKKTNQADCLFSSQSIVEYSCPYGEPKKNRFCHLGPKSLCEKIKNQMAIHLSLIHSLRIPLTSGPVTKCYFQAKLVQ